MKAVKSPHSLAIERVRRHLERWRRTRAHPRVPIPERIWAAAVALARERGLYQTARALPIHYSALKQHLEAADRPRSAGARSGFVELSATDTRRDDCVIEVDGPRTTVRIRLHRIELPDVARLSRAIAGVEA